MPRLLHTLAILGAVAGPPALASAAGIDGPASALMPGASSVSADPSPTLPAPVLAVTPSSSSPAITSLSPSSAALSATPSPALPTQSDPACPCGYTLTEHGGAYFRNHYALDFSTVPNIVGTDENSLADYGWIIRHNGKVGGINPEGTKCTGKAENIAVRDGVLELTMPGGQSVSGSKELFGAEMKFGEPATHGVFTVRGKVSKEPGACQAFWTEYHDKEAGNKDEQDMEIMGHALMDEGTLGAGEYGLWMTNWDPTDTANERREHTTWHFPQDPTLDFHNYTIGWMNDTTHYFYDGTELNAPQQYSSINPSDLTINCWSNGAKGWSQGPPINDVVLRVSAVDFYYEAVLGEGPPDGCTLQQACVVH